jgi:hypothetical protein
MSKRITYGYMKKFITLIIDNAKNVRKTYFYFDDTIRILGELL